MPKKGKNQDVFDDEDDFDEDDLDDEDEDGDFDDEDEHDDEDDGSDDEPFLDYDPKDPRVWHDIPPQHRGSFEWVEIKDRKTGKVIARVIAPKH
jgi:hypothetical protein